MRVRITRKASIQSVYRAERIVIRRIWPKVDPNSSFSEGSTVSRTGSINVQPDCGVADNPTAAAAAATTSYSVIRLLYLLTFHIYL